MFRGRHLVLLIKDFNVMISGQGLARYDDPYQWIAGIFDVKRLHSLMLAKYLDRSCISHWILEWESELTVPSQVNGIEGLKVEMLILLALLMGWKE